MTRLRVVSPGGRGEVARAASVGSPRAPLSARLLRHRQRMRALRRLIRHRTNGLIADLRVRRTVEGIVLAGRCDTYYYKQVAQQIVFEQEPRLAVRNEIQVIRPLLAARGQGCPVSY